MMKKLLISILIIGILLAGYYLRTQQTLKPTNYKDVTITLERTGCFGRCPIYKVSIYGDGKVEYTGIDFVSELGHKTKQVSQKEVSDLVDKFYEINYFSLQDSYTEPITDLPTTISSITINGKTKRIENYYGGPKKLSELEDAIDQVVKTALSKSDENNSSTSTQFPSPINRTKTKNNYSDWPLYKHESGYSFYYPNNWFITEDGNQVQSWDPNKVTATAGPLGRDQTKWDLYFVEKPFSSFEETLAETDNGKYKWDKVETSSTASGWTVYFAYKETIEPFGNPYLIAIIVTPENKSIAWAGFSGVAKSDNIERLKQIVESIYK